MKSYRENMSADEQRQFLGDQVGEVDQRRAMGGIACQDKDLGIKMITGAMDALSFGSSQEQEK